MRKSVCLGLLLLAAVPRANAQAQDYPRYIQEGSSSYVIMTVEQAQKLDNDVELLNAYKKVKTGSDSLIHAYISVINASNQRVALLDLKNSLLEKLDTSQKSLITNLESQIENYKTDLSLAGRQLRDKDTIIRNKDREIRKQKTEKIVGFGVAVLAIAALIVSVL